MQQLLQDIGNFIAFVFAAGHTALSLPEAQRYFRTLLILAGIVLATPFAFIVLGLATGSGMVVALAGIFLALVILFLFAYASPLALAIGTIFQVVQRRQVVRGVTTGGVVDPVAAGKWWVDKMIVVLFWELFLGVLASILPIHQNPRVVPQFILAWMLVGVASLMWNTQVKWLKRITFGGGALVGIYYGILIVFPNMWGTVTAAGTVTPGTARTAGTAMYDFLTRLDGKYPLCGGAAGPFYLSVDTPEFRDVPLREDCQTGMVAMPVEEGWMFRVQTSGNMIEFEFPDGTRVLFGPNDGGDVTRLLRKWGRFRLRGDGRITRMWVYRPD